MFKYEKLLLIIMFQITAWSSNAVTVGEQAPEFVNIQWIKNGPVNLSSGKGSCVYAIEFWATWCQPCLDSIPHLTALQQKYKDHGLVIVGISIDEDVRIAKEFASKNTAMQYNVGFDTDSKTSKQYITENSGIPVVFVIDKNGTVVWSGHPMEMDNILESVIDGTFDGKKFVLRLHLNKQIMLQMMSKNYSLALKYSDDLLNLESGNEQSVGLKAYLLHLAGNDDSAISFIDEQIKANPDKAGLLNTKISFLYQLKKYQALDAECDTPRISCIDPMVLNMIANGIINSAPLQYAKIALKIANTAYARCHFKDNEQKSIVAATLAECYFKLNKTEQAVEMQKNSIGLIKDNNTIKLLEKRLKEYQNRIK